MHVYLRSDGCPDCLAAAQACVPGALQVAGKWMTVAEVMETVRRDIPFYGAAGGLTITGGEPTMQPAFATTLAAAAQAEGISVVVETCGMCDPDVLLTLAKHADLFLYDIKETDPIRHRAHTGADPQRILDNLRALDTAGHPTVLRCPVIPGLNDRADHMEGISAIANALQHVQAIELMPYHPLGQGKAERFGIQGDPALPQHVMAKRDAETLAKYLRDRTHIAVRVS